MMASLLVRCPRTEVGVRVRASRYALAWRLGLLDDRVVVE